MKSFRHRIIKQIRRRRPRAFSLIELMVALAISGIVIVTLGSSLSEQMRFSTKSQKLLLASFLARQVIERVRATPFDQLPDIGVPKYVRVASGDSSDPHSYDLSQPILDRPLQIDAVNLLWLSPDVVNPMPISKFSGEVSLTMGVGPSGPNGTVPDTKTANVLVTWTDDSPRQFSLKAIVCRFGIQADK